MLDRDQDISLIPKDDMDGDASRRALDKGASSGLKDQEFSDAIHEDSKPRSEPIGEKTTGGKSLFDAGGAIGKQFTTDGAIGGTAEKVGGPFAATGSVGKQFTTGGGIGGRVQDTLGQGESNAHTHQK